MEKQQLPTIEEVFAWMRKLYDESYSGLTSTEKSEQHMYGTMVTTPTDKKFIVRMLDETSQIRDRQKLALRVKELIDQYGIPQFLDKTDHALFWMYQHFAYQPMFNWVAVPIIKWRLRRDTSRVIINAARPSLTQHLATRFREDIGQNVNLLGEVVLGDAEADKRYYSYFDALKEPDINYISVKISGIYAQTHALNYKECYPELIRRISALYQAAIDNPYTDVNGVTRPKFINLDMEEYKDAHLTMRVFKDVLSLPKFKNLEAGIVVQAYLPDAEGFQTELLEFARRRVADGGSPIKMRIVKGCNLDMENIVSDLRGWPNPVRKSKTEVDANYLHIIERGLKPENARVLHIGMASHNLFTISYAYLLTQLYQTPKDCFCFEMLEGMANHVWRAQKKLGNHVILYTPVVKKENFLNAISYLVRRMDENTAPDNFLTHSFSLKPDTKEWRELQQQFIDAYNMKDHLDHTPTRTQDRNKETWQTPSPLPLKGEGGHHLTGEKTAAQIHSTLPLEGEREEGLGLLSFKNEPDTDFDRECNQRWVEKILEKWQNKECIVHSAEVHSAEVHSAEVHSDTLADRNPESQQSLCTMHSSTMHLLEVANLLGSMRADLCGCLCANVGKTIEEADAEVTMAMDYCRYYAASIRKLQQLGDIEMRPHGSMTCTASWNAPLAAPVGSLAAALVCGNLCTLHADVAAAPVARLFLQAFRAAGFTEEQLRFDETSFADIQLPKGYKNAIILTAKGDRCHAIMNACHSAFRGAGQGNSACSLLLVERSVYESEDFMEKLKDCASSLKCGPVWNAGNIVGPMIIGTNERLQRALQLNEGERWLVSPEFADEEHRILRPTVKLQDMVRPNSYTFRTPLCAPLLTVAPFDTLEEAVALVNSLGSITSGLQSLDEQEQRYWKSNVQVSNLYINRGITGAVVGRQPFGGKKEPASGGSNYLLQFMTIRNKADSKTDYRKSYAEWFTREFRHARNLRPDIRGEQNILRYLPLRHGGMALRLCGGETLEQVQMVVEAATTVGTVLTVSFDKSHPLANQLIKATPCLLEEESLNDFCAHIKKYERTRVISDNVPDQLTEAAAAAGKPIVQAAPVSNGRIELPRYLCEQSISNEYHRYGSQIEVPAVD